MLLQKNIQHIAAVREIELTLSDQSEVRILQRCGVNVIIFIIILILCDF